MKADNERWGLVLAGGGTRGAFEAGVWKAICELGLNIRGIVGTSIGALNAALMLQESPNALETLWNTIQIDDFLPTTEGFLPEKDIFDPQNIITLVKEFVHQGGLDNTTFHQTVQKLVNPDKIYASPLDYGIVTYEIRNLEPIYLFKDSIPMEHLIDYIVASANFPIFKAQDIRGRKFIDGGVADNMPFNLLLDHGYTHLITVNIDAPGIYHTNDSNPDVYIKNIGSSENLGGMFNFNRERIRRNFDLGYLDTLKAFHKLVGFDYYFSQESFRDLLNQFDLQAIHGLECAAAEFKMERCKVYTADEFLSELANLLRNSETIFKTRKEWDGIPDISQLRDNMEDPQSVAYFTSLLAEQPAFRQTNPLAKVFPDLTDAGAAMNELKKLMKI